MSRPLPRLLSISPPEPASCSMWVASSSALAGVPGVGLLLRLPVEREPAIEPWLDHLEDRGVTVILHVRTPGAAQLAEMKGHGLHLTSQDEPAEWRGRIRGPLGVSCHTRAELVHAAKFCDYATLSPVYTPLSKPGDLRAGLGLGGLRRACAGIALPVFALGGLGPGRVRACLEAGSWGVAGIGAFGDPDALATMAAELG
jgi:8-oxo-dGTP diphosphatase